MNSLNSLIRYSELLYHQQGNIELYYLYTYYRTLFYHTQFLILTALQTLRASGLSQAITKFAFPTFTPLCRRSSLPLASSITIALSLPTSVGVLQIASASFFLRVAFSRGMQMELSAPNGVINARCHRDVLPDDFFCHGVRGRSGGSIVIGRIDIISFQNRAPRTSAPPVPLRFLGLCQFSGPLLFFSLRIRPVRFASLLRHRALQVRSGIPAAYTAHVSGILRRSDQISDLPRISSRDIRCTFRTRARVSTFILRVYLDSSDTPSFQRDSERVKVSARKTWFEFSS